MSAPITLRASIRHCRASPSVTENFCQVSPSAKKNSAQCCQVSSKVLPSAIVPIPVPPPSPLPPSLPHHKVSHRKCQNVSGPAICALCAGGDGGTVQPHIKSHQTSEGYRLLHSPTQSTHVSPPHSIPLSTHQFTARFVRAGQDEMAVVRSLPHPDPSPGRSLRLLLKPSWLGGVEFQSSWDQIQVPLGIRQMLYRIARGCGSQPVGGELQLSDALSHY